MIGLLNMGRKRMAQQLETFYKICNALDLQLNINFIKKDDAKQHRPLHIF